MFTAGSFKSRLVLLVLLAFVPGWLLLFISNVKRQEGARSHLTTQALSAAQVAAASQEYYVKQSRQLLLTMSQFQHLVKLQDLRMSRFGMTNLKTISPDYRDFGIVETNGVVFCHTLDTNFQNEVISEAAAQEALSKAHFSMSQLHQLPGTNGLVLQFFRPVFENDQMVRLLYGSLKPELLSEPLKMVDLPAGGTITVLDPGTNVVSRFPSPERWVGRNLADVPEMQAAMAGQETYQAESEGEQRVFAVKAVKATENSALRVVVSIPRSVLFAQADAEFGGGILGMIIIGAIIIAATRYFSKRAFLQPVGSLVAATERITAGDLTARSGLTHSFSELHLLGKRFDTMAENLARREAELKRAQEALAKTNAELECRVAERTKELQTLNDELEAFSYSVSHDLRAPLRRMDGFAQLLADEEGISSNDQAQKFLGFISKGSKQMSQLIDDLLSFSKMSRQSMQVRPVDSANLVAQIVSEAQRTPNGSRVLWKISPLPAVTADEALLRQVWENLISNAVKYSSKREQPVIEIDAYPEGGEMVFRVKDNGAGFDMKYAERLFGVFQRLHTVEEFEGTGIGLANIRRIISRHGGRTWAEAEVDKGAQFYFTIPVGVR